MTNHDASISATGRHERDPRRSFAAPLSWPQFATLLGVSTETYRTWDSGRRLVPNAWLDKARALAAASGPNRLRSLKELATELRVHVRTLRDAARSGRLDVVYATKPKASASSTEEDCFVPLASYLLAPVFCLIPSSAE
jgi:hypothetical protein